MVSYLLVALYIVVALLLTVVVLLQQGKGGGMAAAFGGASSQTAFGARSGATVLTRATAVLAALFMVGAFLLTVLGRTGGGSVVGGPDLPAAPTLPIGVPELPADAPEAGTPDAAPAPSEVEEPAPTPDAAAPEE